MPTYTPEQVQAKLREIRARNAAAPVAPTSQPVPSPTPSPSSPPPMAQDQQPKYTPEQVQAKLREIRARNAAVATPPTTQTAPPQKEKSTFDKVADVSKAGLETATQVATGVAKGAFSTVASVGGLGSRVLEGAYNKTLGKLTGKNAAQGAQMAEDVKKEYLTPSNTAQKVGFGAEQVGEFFVPGGAVSKGAKAVEVAAEATKLPKLVKAGLGLAGRVGLEAGASAAVTAAQGGDAKNVVENAALGAGGALAGKAIGSVGKRFAPGLQASAEKGYAQALGATTKENKMITQKVVPELIKRNKWALSRSGLQKTFDQGVEVAGTQMDEALSHIPKDASVNLSNVVNDLERAKESFMVQGASGKMVIADPQAVQHIEGFQSIIKEIGTTDAPYESVRKLRQIWDKSVADAKGFYGRTVTEGSLLDAKKEAANALRGELAKEFPDMDKANKDYHFWSNAQKVLASTIERTQSQRKPLTETIRRTTGAVIGSSVGGGVGAVLGDMAMSGLSKLVDSTAWKTIGSIQKSSIANFLAAGKLKEAIDLMTRIAASQNKK